MATFGATQLEAAGKLIPFDDVMETLSATENLSKRTVQTDGTDPVEFNFSDLPENFPEMHSTDVLPHHDLRVANSDYQITKGAYTRLLQQVGLRTTYGQKTPGSLLNAHLNYHYAHANTKADMLTLMINDGVVLEVAPGNQPVFSSYNVVDTVSRAAASHFGADRSSFYFDYKAEMILDRTALRLIVPDTQRVIKTSRGSAQVEDIWSTGISIQNSMAGDGAVPLEVSGYMFAWWCTNGCTTDGTHAETYSRRGIGADWDSVQGWLEDSTTNILGQLPSELEKVEELTSIDLTGEIGTTLRDMARRFGTPISVANSIRDSLAESDDLSAYGFMQAITQTANEDDMEDRTRSRILAAGGGLVHSMVDRCEACHRLPA